MLPLVKINFFPFLLSLRVQKVEKFISQPNNKKKTDKMQIYNSSWNYQKVKVEV